MGAGKRVLFAILSIIFCISVLSSAVLAESYDIDIYEMADALNRLNILQGDNGNYNLDDNLERAQATALIIRMLGKEEHIRQNADLYKYTKFEDVDPARWYAPYVGYGTQYGIIAGLSSSSFEPLEKITEKAFLKMTLCALGYVYNEDFDWTNVFQKAYETGIVTDSSYQYKVDDNNDYLRRDAVRVLYQALNTCKKGSDVKMAYTLVEEGLFTKDELLESGIFGSYAFTTAEIVSINAIAPNNVEIQLNTDVKELKLEDFEVTEKGSDKELEVKAYAFRDNTIVAVTAGQIPGKSYKLTLNSFIDASGFMAGPVSGIFKGYSPMQVISDFFRIQKVEQTSVNTLDVYFTHPLNISSENPVYYELFKNGSLFVAGSSQNTTVRMLQSAPNAVSIYLKNDTFEPGQVYTLRVSGKMLSGYGVPLYEGHGETTDFTAAIEQSSELEVISVAGQTSNTVRIVFNKEVDPAWASKKLNYTVINAYDNEVEVKKAVITVNGENSGREVILTLASSLDRTKQYGLKIEYIPDLYKQSAIEAVSMKFSGAYPSPVELVLTGAKADYANYVELQFNKPLDPTDASDFSKYVIRPVTSSGLVIPKKAYYSVENSKYTVRLFLPDYSPLEKSRDYTVFISNLKDAQGTTGTNLLRREFTVRSDEIIKPGIIDAVTISGDSIKLLFNMELAFNPANINVTNYILEYEENRELIRKAPMGITYIDPVTVILRFDELDPSLEYKLWFDKLYDYSETYISTSSSVQVRWGR